MRQISYPLRILGKRVPGYALLIPLLPLLASTAPVQPAGDAMSTATHPAIVVAQVTPAPSFLPAPEPPIDIVPERVLGQTTFVTAEAGVTASMLDSPSDVLADRVSGRLWVADSNNHRVLSWPSANAFANGQPADLVLGQPDFTTRNPSSASTMNATTLAQPAGMAMDAQGRLYVADYRNSRVLQFTPPFTNGMAASVVFGAPTFTDFRRGPTSSATSLLYPQGVAIDSAGNLFVSDTSHNRVLRYTPPFSNGMAADLVLGQADMISSRPNQSGTATATSLSHPKGLAFDQSGNLYVVDELNFRVLQYVPPFFNNMPAAQVLGAPDFFSRFLVDSPTNSFSSSLGAVATDPLGNVYVADRSRARVLQFQAPITTGQAALRAFGQPDLTRYQNNNPSLGPTSLSQPNGVSVDAEGDVYIADTGNNRVMAYD